MENNEAILPVPTEPAATPPKSVADMSLADYRASRKTSETTAAASEATPTDASAAVDPVADLEADGSPSTPEQVAEKKKKLGGFQKTIAKQNDEIAELRRQLAAGAPPAAATPTTPAPAPAEPVFDKPKPKLEDCDSIEDYADKLTDWKADERDWKREQKAEAAKRAEAGTKLATDWTTRAEAFKSEHDDYDAVIAGVNEVKLSAAHQQLFLQSEHGPALAYELAQNPEELKKLAALPPLQAARVLGKLEAKYAATAATPEPQVSKAPRPISPVSGGTVAATRPDPAKLSLADYRKARESGRLR